MYLAGQVQFRFSFVSYSVHVYSYYNYKTDFKAALGGVHYLEKLSPICPYMQEQAT